MTGWYHWLNGHEFYQTQGDSEGQGRTGKPGVLQFMGSQRFGHNLATEQQQQKGKEFKQIKPSNEKKVVCIMNIAGYGNVNTTKKFSFSF